MGRYNEFNAYVAPRMFGSGESTSAPAAPGSSRGSQTKSWACTWCHQTVTAASRPPLAGGPRNSAGQHAWHN